MTSKPLVVFAGLLEARYDHANLRYVRLGDVEILRHLYMAVRDPNWDTIPAKLSNLEFEGSHDSFTISFDAANVEGEIDFRWHGELRGSPDGIEAVMDGVAASSFWKNRIGWCALHPTHEYAGKACAIGHTDGTSELEHFPVEVSPHQPFLDVRSMSCEVVPGVVAHLSFEGDVFETEDQRNWTDNSFKTYSTPLELGYPKLIEKGQRIHQKVSLKVSGKRLPAVKIFEGRRHKVPKVGLGTASVGGPLDEREVKLLTAVRPAHLRVDLRPAEPTWLETLLAADADARKLSSALEVAAHLSEARREELAMLRAELPHLQSPVSRLILFDTGKPSTTAESMTAAHEILRRLRTSVPIGGGTDSNFAELNRNRAVAGVADFLSYPASPQVHLPDNDTIVENLPAHAHSVASARKLGAGRAVILSPVTIKARFNPGATGPTIEKPGELPYSVDARLTEPFAAAWLTCVLKHAAEAGAESLTCFETAGWRGVIERTEGSPMPDLFPSQPGSVFPVYHLLAAIAEFEPDAILETLSAAPLEAEALVLNKGAKRRILVANLRPDARDIVVGPIHGKVRTRALGAQSWSDAGPTSGDLRVSLAPYAVAVVDVETPAR
jgi:D-apionolactonase